MNANTSNQIKEKQRSALRDGADPAAEAELSRISAEKQLAGANVKRAMSELCSLQYFLAKRASGRQVYAEWRARHQGTQ